MKNVAIIGRPNVGKSTLINRIIGRRKAMVEDQPGVTRDRISYPTFWNGVDFNLVDTGGWVSKGEKIDEDVVYQTKLAINSAELLIFLVDVHAGVTAEDEAIAKILRKSKKPVIVAVNKVDNGSLEIEVPQFYALGFGKPYPISAMQGRDIGDFLDLIVKDLKKMPKDSSSETSESIPKIAIIGRPNVGKSSLLNYLAHENRVVVNELAGTTRDSIDEEILIDDNKYLFIDTAGLKKSKLHQANLDYYSSIRTNDAIFRCDLALLLIDSSEGLGVFDLKIINQIISQGKAINIMFNKYDLLDSYQKELLKQQIKEELANYQWIPQIFGSVLTQHHLDKIEENMLKALKYWSFRIPTHQLNKFFDEITLKNPHKVVSGKQPKIQYASQVSIQPPKIILHTTGSLDPQYLRFIENQLRQKFDFFGSPIQLVQKVKTPNSRFH